MSMIGPIIALAAMYGFMGVLLTAIHSQDTGDGLYPLTRDPKKGEPRWRYYLTQFPRAQLWFPGAVILLLYALPSIVRWLREPLRRDYSWEAEKQEKD